MDRSTLQLGLTVLTLLAVAFVGVRQQGLASRLDALESAPAGAVAVSSEASPVARRLAATPAQRMAAGQVQRAALMQGQATGGGGAEAASEEVIQDALWSEEGRSAIDEVVAEREEAERQRQMDRWKRMRERYTQRAVDDLAEEFDLTDAVADDLTGLLNDYNDVRTKRWEAMQDDDVDLDALEEESDRARERLEADITALAGADVYTALEEMYRNGGRGR